MKLQIWKSFSANNSSAYILVARFAEAGRAKIVRDEFRAFVAANTREIFEDLQRARLNEWLTMTALEFGETHGIPWDGRPIRGAGMEIDELAEVEVEIAGDQLGLWHIYCHGFEDYVQDYLRVRGGVIERAEFGRAELSILANIGSAVDQELLVSELGRRFLGGGRPPETQSEHFGYFFDGTSVGLCGEFRLAGIARVREILEEHGVSDYRLTLDGADIERFSTIARAICSGCGTGRLRFVDAVSHGIDRDQLACEACGAMYDLEVFR